jgi:hypothetical protein
MRKTAFLILFIGSQVFAADLQKEIPTIKKAAERNGIKFGSDDWFLLLAIRQAENGGPGRELGILSKTARTLDAQAANAACTIIKQHRRSGCKDVTPEYIAGLAARYCPVGARNDPAGTNKNWFKNVSYWYKKLQEQK